MTRVELLQKLNNAKLKKVRSKMIREALEKGTSSNGNHMVVCFNNIYKEQVFDIFYRNTRIAYVLVSQLMGVRYASVNAGEFESTPATIRQRKEIQDAVAELQSILEEVS